MQRLTLWINRLIGLHKREYHLSQQAVFLILRWLVFLCLLMLSCYDGIAKKSLHPVLIPFSITLLYAFSNLILTFGGARRLQSFHASSFMFLWDLVLIGSALYFSVGLDEDLYLICFLIIYLSTLGRKVRDALPMAGVAGILYFLLLARQHPRLYLIDPHILLRFPFFFILAFFTTYLSEESEKNLARVKQLETARSRLEGERDSVVRELDKKQAELVQAEKLSAMGHMSGALAHEIRNPLCVIIGYLGEMVDSLPSSDPHYKFLSIMQRCANRCNLLVENLLRFARQPKDEERFALNQVILEAMELARIGKKARKVQCVAQVENDFWMMARRSEIEQVIMNLSANAMDAMPEGGTLTVRARRPSESAPDWLVIEVEDTGAGIAEEMQKRIFDPFFTTKAPGQGTGLGLSIVRDILRGYGGAIEVRSACGRGTTFTLRLPASRIVEASDAAKPVLAGA